MKPKVSLSFLGRVTGNRWYLIEMEIRKEAGLGEDSGLRLTLMWWLDIRGERQSR